jgi:4-amino-4-deoxy-L-arabinose transferase-like glycosyltransferase
MLVVLVVGVGARVWFALRIQHPGHGDFSFYYTLGENLATGRGFQIDYIWHYLSNPTTLTHYANDYWMPMTAIIISISMAMWDVSLFAALLPSIGAGVGLVLLTFLLAMLVAGSRRVALWSSAIMVVLPTPFYYSLVTDSTIYYSLFVTLCLFFLVWGMLHAPHAKDAPVSPAAHLAVPAPAPFILAAVWAALAHLTRQDGMLLVPVIGGAIFFSALPRRTMVMTVLAAGGAYLLILAPLLSHHLARYGVPFPPGPGKTMFLTSYEDLYVFSKPLSFQSYLQWGWSAIIWSKLEALFLGFLSLRELLPLLLWVPVVVGLYDIIIAGDRSQKTASTIFFSFLFILLGFHALVATFPGVGAFARSSTAIIPLLAIILVATIFRRIPSPSLATLLMVLILAFSFSLSVGRAQQIIARHNAMATDLERVREIITEDARAWDAVSLRVGNTPGQREVVIMTRYPWQVYHSTRYRTTQLPNEDRDTIYQVAQQFGATYLLLPAPREAMRPLYVREEQDPRFPFVADVSDSYYKVFRIVPRHSLTQVPYFAILKAENR